MKTILFFLAGICLSTAYAQNLQVRYGFLQPSTNGPADLQIPYQAGSGFPQSMVLNVEEELAVKNVSANVDWCICVKITPLSQGGNTLQISLDDYSPSHAVNLIQTNSPLSLTTTNQPFISGSGVMNFGKVHFALLSGSMPTQSSFNYQVLYTLLTGPCPVNNL